MRISGLKYVVCQFCRKTHTHTKRAAAMVVRDGLVGGDDGDGSHCHRYLVSFIRIRESAHTDLAIQFICKMYT